MRYVMIMAGGSGTRLWPLSRAERPKQLVPLRGGRSLLQLAFDRAAACAPADRVLVCAAERHREAILRGLPDLAEERFLGEPEGRDTAAAVGLTAEVLLREDPEATFAVLTADHLIEPVETFRERLLAGFDLVDADARRLVTFAIRPTEPATGYGYVEQGDPIAGANGAYEAAQFVEKPDAATAQRYVESGRFGWNSGMFVWKARTFLEALEKHKPDLRSGLAEIGAALGTSEAERAIRDIYPALPKISVDYAVMEPASADEAFGVCMVWMDVAWRDVGSWPSFAATLDADDQGNRAMDSAGGADTTALDCRDSLVVNEAPGHHIAAVGCEGLVIVHTADATLVMPASHAQRLKELHGRLPEELK